MPIAGIYMGLVFKTHIRYNWSMTETITQASTGNASKITNNKTGEWRISSSPSYEESTKVLDSDILGFSIDKGDLVWYVDKHGEPIKIGKVIGKTKAHIRVQSFVSGIKQYERNVPRHRVYKLDPLYFTLLAQDTDGFVLPTSNEVVTDIAGNVLNIGDPVIFSNSLENSFLLGVVSEIVSPTKIVTKTFSSAYTRSQFDDDQVTKDSLANKLAYSKIAPSGATEIAHWKNITRSTNVLKITFVSNRDIDDFYGEPALLTLARLGNILVPDIFKSSEDYVFGQEHIPVSSRGGGRFAIKGFAFTVVKNGVESAHIINIIPVSILG